MTALAPSVFLLIASSSCGGSPTPPSAGGPDPGGAPPPPAATSTAATSDTAAAALEPAPPAASMALAATLDGKPVQFAHATATSRGGSAIEVSVATAPNPCRDAKGYRELAPGAEEFTLTVAPILQKDGTKKWAIIKGWYKNNSFQQDFGTVQITPDLTKVVRFTVPKMELKGGDPAKVLSVEGPLEAKGCGVVALGAMTGDDDGKSAEPVGRPQPDLKLSIAGNPLPITSAIINQRKGAFTEIELSTGVRNCTRLRGEADVTYRLELDKDKKAKGAWARGDVLPMNVSASFDKKTPGPAVTLGKEAGGEMEITLAGEADHNGYKVKLDGKLKALVCPRKG